MNAAAGFLGKAAAKAREDLLDFRQKSNQLSHEVSERLLRSNASGPFQNAGGASLDKSAKGQKPL